MKRTTNSFSLLQAIAATAGLAILLWSIGLPSLRFAEAANVTSYSDTLSTSNPGVVADHTISFVATNGIAAGESITITIPDTGFTGIGSLVDTDLSLSASTGGARTLGSTPSGTTWGASGSGQTITFTSGTDSIAASDTVTIVIGGTNKITNSSTPGPYDVDLVSGSQDLGATIIAIVPIVTVTASVDTLFTFTVAGVAGGTLVNTSDTTGGTTTANTIPFGKLDAGTASTAAQNLQVVTNAKNGFVVTVATDGQLASTNGADIDSFIEGGNTTSPTAWATPVGVPGSDNTYGHWGVSSNDDTLTGGLSDLYTGGDNFVAVLTTPTEVFRHDGPIDGSTSGEGTTEVIYKVEINALQEAADDYQAILTYVATPVF